MDLDARIRELAVQFLPEWRASLERLTEAIDASDLPEAERTAHMLAGALGSFGFGEAGMAARHVEAALRAGDLHEASKAIVGLRTGFLEIETALAGPDGPVEV